MDNLITAARAALDNLDDFVARCNGDDRGSDGRIEAIRRFLAAAEAHPAEPIGVEALAEVVQCRDGTELFWLVEREIDARIAAIAADRNYWREQAQAPQPLTDEQIKELVLATVYEGDSSTPHRDAWADEIGIPFARAIEASHGIGAKP